MYCECGTRLVCFDGESYCPDCTRYEAEELARQADDEARLLRQAQTHAARPDESPPDDGPPF